MKKLFVLFLFSPLFIFAQDTVKIIPCYTDEYYEYLQSIDPGIQAAREAMDKIPVKPILDKEDEPVVKIIPVVFHIIHMNGTENIPDERVFDVMLRINEDFAGINADTSEVRELFKPIIANCKFEFRLARIDPDGNCTNGITRTYSTLTEGANDAVKNVIRWNTREYLNIWVVKSIYETSSGTILGYSTLPFSAGSNKDGIVIRADRISYELQHRTLTHELGHYLGLYHPFQAYPNYNGNGCQAGDCNNTGDQVCDTPPEKEDQYHCNKNTNSCSNDNPDLPDLLENHMCYSSCRVMFTQGQKERMHALVGNYRSTIYSNNNLVHTGVYDTNDVYCKPVADFSAYDKMLCGGMQTQFKNQSLAYYASTFTWNFQGGVPEYSTEKDPFVSYNTPGLFKVSLTVTSPAGNSSLVKDDYIFVYPSTGKNTPCFEDFALVTFGDDYWNLNVEGSDHAWERTNKASYSGNHSLYLNNYSITQSNLDVSFIMPPIDMRTLSNPVLAYYYAYARKSASSSDRLKIYASEDCGSTWSLRSSVSASKLKTVIQDYSSEFKPGNASDWNQESLDLYRFREDSNLLIKFTFTSEEGNNIYIDDIAISDASTSIKKTVAGNKDIILYPNPTSSNLHLLINNNSKGEYVLIFYDMMGKKIDTKTIYVQEGSNKFVFNLRESGMQHNALYLIKIVNEEEIYTRYIMLNE
jgi:PKD repeat protein